MSKQLIQEKKLTAAELKKREEIAKAIEKDHPGIDMGKKMAIATAAAKRVTESEELDEKEIVASDRKTVMIKTAGGMLKPKKTVNSVVQEDTKYSMISFKEYKQLYEQTEASIDQQIKEAKASLGLDESSPFDWKNTKSEINWKDKSTGTSTDTGTVYKAKSPSQREKKSVGRPAGQYGNYNIDKETRNSKEYKDALSAKVRAAKAEGFAVRDEFKKAMDDAIKKHH